MRHLMLELIVELDGERHQHLESRADRGRPEITGERQSRVQFWLVISASTTSFRVTRLQQILSEIETAPNVQIDGARLNLASGIWHVTSFGARLRIFGTSLPRKVGTSDACRVHKCLSFNNNGRGGVQMHAFDDYSHF
jgi:hypothetical protein